ncbi:MAG: dicarboxylate/amino acid:cation symporter, partial [Clostridia bacterium]|nr:dicarboxylate/amino acid:cation symporter [Clostridia bacterium]
VKVGGAALLWYVGTTAVASALGLVLPGILGLGKGTAIKMVEAEVEATQFSSLLDTVKTLIPSNPFASFTEGNMLQVLVFAIIIGLTCLAVKEKAKPVVDVCSSINDISIYIVGKVMLFTPLGVGCSIATVVYDNGIDTMIDLGAVLLTLYITMFVYAFIVYGGMVKWIAKMPALKFFKGVMPAAMNAFGTCSSSATIPLSMKCADENLEIPSEVTSLTLPLGATINMDAVSILMSFMITFFGNACGVSIPTTLMIVVLFSNVLLSIGTPGVPGGAIASFAALATIAGLPAGVLGVYISINTLCDMGATCVNVLGDLACSTVIGKTLKLKKAQ